MLSQADGGQQPGSVVMSCTDISYAYLDRFPALDEVSLQVFRGESLALLGANGCGKSTLLKILDGLLFPSTGSFVAFDQPITAETLEDVQLNAAFRSRVGFVFQNSDAQVFSPTVREELAFGPLQLGLDRATTAERVADIMSLLQIVHLADRAPFQLSAGQKKRVAIASVLVMNPEVLLFDEPTAGLDPRTAEWLLGLIEELSAAGKTIVLATHDIATLSRIASRCLVFSEDHRVVATGSPDAILDQRSLLLEVNLIHPATDVTRRFQ